MKLVYLFALFFMFFSSLALAQCVEGIDDICDPACIDVDYDCLQAPGASQQDSQCKPSPDGFCQEECQDVDYDCILQQREERFEVNQIITQESQSQTFSFQEQRPSMWAYMFILLGVLLLGIFLLVIFYHLRQRKNSQKYDSLIPRGQAALSQGYTLDDIKSSLKNRGYSDDYIKDYLKALEHRP